VRLDDWVLQRQRAEGSMEPSRRRLSNYVLHHSIPLIGHQVPALDPRHFTAVAPRHRDAFELLP
jgi:hypothetical protein